MVMHLTTHFNGQVPSIDSVYQALIAASGLDVLYDRERWTFINPYDEYDSFIIDEEHYTDITITVGRFEISYLMGVTLRLLKEMGGKSKEEIPDWAVYDWVTYKKLVND